MTVENCLKLLAIYKEKKMTKAYENMKQHILSTRKFKGHPILEELTEKPKPVVKKKVKKENGKRRNSET